MPVPATLARLVTDRVAGHIAIVAGAVMAALGATYAIRRDLDRELVDRPIDHIVLTGLAVVLVLVVPATLALGRRGGVLGRRGSLVAAAGLVGLAVTCTVSNVNGADPAWFVVAAPVANLMWLGGWVAVAVALFRTRAVARPLAVALPLSWIALLPLSMLGGGLLAGGYWLALGTLMATGGLAGRTTRDGVAVTAS